MGVVTEEMEELFGTKMPWADREELLNAKFPSIEQLAWERAFKADSVLLGECLRGILKYDQARKGKPGPRPVANRKSSQARLSQFMGEDYSIEPMAKTLADLKGDMSIRKFAAKVGINYNTIFQLLHGQAPDLYTMRQIATACDKDPSYFLEYRLYFIVAALTAKIKEWPESSIVTYRKLKGDEF